MGWLRVCDPIGDEGAVEENIMNTLRKFGLNEKSQLN